MSSWFFFIVRIFGADVPSRYMVCTLKCPKGIFWCHKGSSQTLGFLKAFIPLRPLMANPVLSFHLVVYCFCKVSYFSKRRKLSFCRNPKFWEPVTFCQGVLPLCCVSLWDLENLMLHPSLCDGFPIFRPGHASPSLAHKMLHVAMAYRSYISWHIYIYIRYYLRIG